MITVLYRKKGEQQQICLPLKTIEEAGISIPSEVDTLDLTKISVWCMYGVQKIKTPSDKMAVLLEDRLSNALYVPPTLMARITWSASKRLQLQQLATERDSTLVEYGKYKAFSPRGVGETYLKTGATFRLLFDQEHPQIMKICGENPGKRESSHKKSFEAFILEDFDSPWEFDSWASYTFAQRVD